MTEPLDESASRWASPEMRAHLRRRNRSEKLFHAAGFGAIALAVAVLALLLGSIAINGLSAFRQVELKLDVLFDSAVLGDLSELTPRERDAAIRRADFGALVRNSLRARFPEVGSRPEVRQLQSLASSGARSHLRDLLLADPSLVGQTRTVWIPADDEVDLLVKGVSPRDAPAEARRLTDAQIAWIDELERDGRLRVAFNWLFLTSGDSREPELAGIYGAMVGSFLTLVITLALAFPLGVAAAVYLEEFAPKNRWTDLIEVNINNLAAVPSIVFGLLGLAVFLNVFHMPRSAPIVGGATLGLMTLPTVIIVSRASISAVPPSIREAARGLGASPLQVVAHHVLPLAMPGILTGTIIGMARALGETAPLLMIGMVAFIVDIPGGFTDAATALPVQIFLWADSPERGFVEKTSGAILVLLAFLVMMNAAAIGLRQRLEKRW